MNSDQKNTRANYIYGSKYILQTDYYDYPCKNFVDDKKYDDRYVKLDSFNYNDLIIDNRINNVINLYPKVPIASYNFDVEIYTRNYLGWRYSCINDWKFGITYLEDLSKSINSITTKLIVQIIMISITLLIFIGLGIFLAYNDNPKIGLIICSIIFVINFVLIILAFFNYISASSINYANTELVSLNCGDQYTELFMKYLSNNLNSLPSTFIGNTFLFVLILLLLIAPFIFILYENSKSLEEYSPITKQIESDAENVSLPKESNYDESLLR